MAVMPSVTYEGQRYELEEGESILETLLRNKVVVPNSCRTGVCQSCLMQAAMGPVPPRAQAGLKDTLKARGFFLSCVCQPAEHLEARLAGAEVQVSATLSALESLGAGVLRVRVRCATGLDHRAGQYVSVLRADGLARSYSIANLPEEGDLELHVRRIPSGRMSGWLHDEARVGDPVRLMGPAGECFYVGGRPEQPLLLVGTGTGLAPLYGIVRDALNQGHTGPIWLFHGARDLGGLYLVDELRALASRSLQLHYRPCVIEGDPTGDLQVGSIDQLVFSQHPKLAGWRVFLCGDPRLVFALRKRVLLAGASMKDIHADAFLHSAG
jgi:NAD(P)H-flavin reductase/ferredoxin